MNKKELSNPESWVNEHGDYLFQFAFVRLRNRAAAEDAVQETFLAGIRALDRYDGKTPVRYWLRGILRHKVVDYIRKASREIATDDTEGADILDSFKFKAFGIANQHPAPWKFDPKHAYEQKEFWEVFYDCMSKLKGNAGLAFTLRELEGMSTEDICKELHLKPNNLWVILHRARTQLKACLEANWTRD
ncbi:sigma-70 family RNA polymerase sigma factor [Pontiella sp.]|uniref:sigma-70 family RNA polymerase sigma factor n=1 Tax=Pontiella sp. TaxID=2837462 RepID=UPI003564DE20